MKKRMMVWVLVMAAWAIAPVTLQARWLNPNTGRFQTSDTFQGDNQDPPSLHKYLYAADDPVNKIDPSGHDWGDFFGSIVAPIDFVGIKAPPQFFFYGNMSGSDQSVVSRAVDEARKYADEAVQHMSSISYSSTTARYVRWFGSPDNTRIDHVKYVWNEVDAAVWRPLTVKRTAGNYYGLTYPLFTSTVRLGSDFWDASTPLTGEDSKAGTLIHEITHLAGGTGDYKYGSADCLTLTTQKPNKAVKNADSYEYFVELK